MASPASKAAPSFGNTMLSPGKCVRCVLWEERHRQWLKEREELLRTVQEQSEMIQQHGRGTGKTGGGGGTSSAHVTPREISLMNEDGAGTFGRRISRQKSGFRTMVADAATMTASEDFPRFSSHLTGRSPSPGATTSAISPPREVAKKAMEELYETEKKRSAELEREVGRLQCVLKGQSLELRDAINENQRAFLLHHAEQVDDERKFLGVQRSLAALEQATQALNAQVVKTPSATAALAAGSQTALHFAKRMEAVATLQRNTGLSAGMRHDSTTDSASRRSVEPPSLSNFAKAAQSPPSNKTTALDETRTCKWCREEIPAISIWTHESKCPARYA